MDEVTAVPEKERFLDVRNMLFGVIMKVGMSVSAALQEIFFRKTDYSHLSLFCSSLALRKYHILNQAPPNLNNKNEQCSEITLTIHCFASVQ